LTKKISVDYTLIAYFLTFFNISIAGVRKRMKKGRRQKRQSSGSRIAGWSVVSNLIDGADFTDYFLKQ